MKTSDYQKDYHLLSEKAPESRVRLLFQEKKPGEEQPVEQILEGRLLARGNDYLVFFDQNYVDPKFIQAKGDQPPYFHTIIIFKDGRPNSKRLQFLGIAA
jgi:hypothetical protein